MSMLTRLAEKTGVVGAVVGSFSCAACFPAAASLGAAIGLGFLSQWEGLFMHWLIPVFAALALLANLLGWFSHRRWQRTVLLCLGPSLVLLGVLGMTQHFLDRDWSRGIFYTGLVSMIVFSLWDLFKPAAPRCMTESCKQPEPSH